MKRILITLMVAFLSIGCEDTFEDLKSKNEPTYDMSDDAPSPIDKKDKTKPNYGYTSSNNTTPNTSGSGDQNFLWKPRGENSNRLVVLLPAQYTGNIGKVFIQSPSGQVLETGGFSGVHNGGREHYRFSKPGSSYLNGSRLVMDLKAGGSKSWTISNTGSRTGGK
jgi:hypothetical protein